MRIYYVRNLTNEVITLRNNYQVVLSLQPSGQSDDRGAVSSLAIGRDDFQSQWAFGRLAVYADPAYQVVISRPTSGELSDALSDGDIDERILAVGNATYVRGKVEDTEGNPVPTKEFVAVIDANGDIENLIIREVV